MKTTLRCTPLLVAGALLTAMAAPTRAATPYAWSLPPGFPAPQVPADNPMTVEKVDLGRQLFYDRRLSATLTHSCGTCHIQSRAFTDGRAQALGATGAPHIRGTMSLTNVAYPATLTWANAHLRTLEAQALASVGLLGMDGREEELLQRLRDDRRYPQLFQAAFPEAPDPVVSLDAAARALAAFQRTLLSGNAPYDRFVNGIDRNALSPAAVRGGRLFFSERLECFHCHGGFNFTAALGHDGQPVLGPVFHNTGLYNLDGHGAYPESDIGLAAVTGSAADMGRFKAPTLRNIAVTAPYMHDGSVPTLDEVIDHYAAAGRTIADGPYAGIGSTSPLKSPLLAGFRLTADERADLIAFLESLTDDDFLADPRFSDPFADDSCRGDCDDSGDVTIDEIIYAVSVALGYAPLTPCMSLDADADGMVDVAELLTAVNRSLAGCQ